MPYVFRLHYELPTEEGWDRAAAAAALSVEMELHPYTVPSRLVIKAQCEAASAQQAFEELIQHLDATLARASLIVAFRDRRDRLAAVVYCRDTSAL